MATILRKQDGVVCLKMGGQCQGGGRGTKRGTQENKLRAQIPSSRPGSPSVHKGMGGGLLGAVMRDSHGQHTSRGHHPKSAGLLSPGPGTGLQNASVGASRQTQVWEATKASLQI